jgi:hypothetical protein
LPSTRDIQHLNLNSITPHCPEVSRAHKVEAGVVKRDVMWVP